MSRKRVQQLLHRATIDIQDANANGLSASGQFGCACDAAIRSAQAFAGENGIDVGNRDLEALLYLVDALQLESTIATKAKLHVNFRRAQGDYVFVKKRAIANDATLWAARVHSAALEWFQAHHPELVP